MDLDRIEDALLGSTRFRRVVHEVSCSSTQDLALRDARTNGDAVTDAVFCTTTATAATDTTDPTDATDATDATNATNATEAADVTDATNTKGASR